jgi:hypothetical protein
VGGWSRRPPVSLLTSVPRTEGYTHHAKVWDLPLIRGPFSVAPCRTLLVIPPLCAGADIEPYSLSHRCAPAQILNAMPSGEIRRRGTLKAVELERAKRSLARSKEPQPVRARAIRC